MYTFPLRNGRQKNPDYSLVTTQSIHRDERREGINEIEVKGSTTLSPSVYKPIRVDQRSSLMGAGETVRLALGMYAGLHTHCLNEGDGGQSSLFCTVNSQYCIHIWKPGLKQLVSPIQFIYISHVLQG